MSLKQNLLTSFKVLNFVSLKLGKFKFRTLEVMKLRGVL